MTLILVLVLQDFLSIFNSKYDLQLRSHHELNSIKIVLEDIFYKGDLYQVRSDLSY